MHGITYNVDTLVACDTNLGGLRTQVDTNDTHGRGVVEAGNGSGQLQELWARRIDMDGSSKGGSSQGRGEDL